MRGSKIWGFNTSILLLLDDAEHMNVRTYYSLL